MKIYLLLLLLNFTLICFIDYCWFDPCILKQFNIGKFSIMCFIPLCFKVVGRALDASSDCCGSVSASMLENFP